MKLGVQLNSFDWEEGPERFATRLAKIAARMAKALPRWISWLGIVQATLAILSLASRPRPSSCSAGCSASSGASP